MWTAYVEKWNNTGPAQTYGSESAVEDLQTESPEWSSESRAGGGGWSSARDRLQQDSKSSYTNCIVMDGVTFYVVYCQSILLATIMYHSLSDRVQTCITPTCITPVST